MPQLGKHWTHAAVAEQGEASKPKLLLVAQVQGSGAKANNCAASAPESLETGPSWFQVPGL